MKITERRAPWALWGESAFVGCTRSEGETERARKRRGEKEREEKKGRRRKRERNKEKYEFVRKEKERDVLYDRGRIEASLSPDGRESRRGPRRERVSE